LQRIGIAPLTTGATTKQSRPIAERHDHDIGVHGERNCLGDAVHFAAVDGSTQCAIDPAARELGRDRLQQCRKLDSDGNLRMLNPDMCRERVTAEYGVRVVGVRADHGNPRRCLERQGTVVTEQHHGAFRQFGSERTIARAVEIDRAT
jgi:hypothetical protein